MSKNFFNKRKSIKQVEESSELAPKFDSKGLIPVITSDYKSGEILGVRLNTYHNLLFFISLVKQARKAIIEKRYLKFKKEFLKKFDSQ